MRIVSGIVSKAGKAHVGDEYSVKVRACDEGLRGKKKNIYDIEFDPPFSTPPVITVTAEHRFHADEDKLFGPYINKIDDSNERLRGFTVIMMKLDDEDVRPEKNDYAAKDENRFHFIAVGREDAIPEP